MAFLDGEFLWQLMLLFSCTQTDLFENLKGSVFMVVLWPALATMRQFGIFLTTTLALPTAQVAEEVQTGGSAERVPVCTFQTTVSCVSCFRAMRLVMWLGLCSVFIHHQTLRSIFHFTSSFSMLHIHEPKWQARLEMPAQSCLRTTALCWSLSLLH